MNILKSLTILLATIWCLLNCKIAYAQQAEIKFEPDSSVSSKLDTEVSILGFAIRPPKNFECRPVADPLEGERTFVCLGPKRADGSRPFLQITLLKLNASVQNSITFDYAVADYLETLKVTRTSLEVSTIQNGYMNGIKYAHATWTGTVTALNKRMKGGFYIAKDRDTIIQLVYVDVETGPLVDLSVLDTSARTFRKVSQKLFYSEHGPLRSSIWSMDPDGTNQKQLSVGTNNDTYPAVSPDGKTVAYISSRSGLFSIWLMNSDGTNQHAVNKEVAATDCCWSPFYDRLAFSRNRDGKSCIYTMKIDGSDEKKITEGPADDSPTWSIDNKIVFESNSSGTWSVMSINSDGSGKAAVLTDSKTNARWPSAAMDGDSILYTNFESLPNPHCHIYLMKGDGSGKTQLTDGITNERHPCWTADGSQILFHSDDSGIYQIYGMDLVTLKPRKIEMRKIDTIEVSTAGRAYSP